MEEPKESKVMTKRQLPKNAKMIPEAAKLVFKGMIFDTYQWEQEMYDGSLYTFEMLRRPDTVVVIAVNDDGRIVTIHEQQPDGIERFDYTPSGRVDPEDESVLAAAQREMKEETGMEFAKWDLIEVNQPEPKIEWFIHVFLARDKTSQIDPKQDSGEKITVGSSDFETVRKNRAGDSSLLRGIETLEELLQFADSDKTQGL
jgi:ADP-ribose pyrophosphatase